MAYQKKVIVVPGGNVRKIAKLFNVTSSAVYNALSYSSNSELTQAVRKQALDYYGGVESTKVFF